MATILKPPVHRITGIQLAAALVAATGCYFLHSSNLALSVLVGALIQIGPQAYFNRMAYRFIGARQASLILRGFYLGESGKLLFSGIFFAIAFVKVPWLNYPALFLAYMAMMVIHSLSAAVLLNQTGN